MALWTVTVERAHAPEVRELLTARVRLQVRERRRFFLRTEFTVEGPEDAIDGAKQDFQAFKNELWAGAQW